jgi:hypothetical protein
LVDELFARHDANTPDEARHVFLVEGIRDDASDAEITIRTLHYLGNVNTDSVQSFWTRNFMLDVKKLSYVTYVDMLKGRKKFNEDRRQLHKECMAAYDDFILQNDEDLAE